MNDKVLVDKDGCNIESFHCYNGVCFLTYKQCDYQDWKKNGCDGCCRAG